MFSVLQMVVPFGFGKETLILGSLMLSRDCTSL
jgi:hypothetical protein